MSTAEAERTWQFTIEGGAVIIEGTPSDISAIASHIADPKQELGSVAKAGHIFMLKVTGIPLSVLRETFHTEQKGWLNEYFPVQCKEHADGHVVEHTDRPAVFPLRMVLKRMVPA